MADFFTRMTAEYAQKHFPDGSVFESAMKTLKRRSTVGIVFSILFLAGGLWGLVWAVRTTMEFLAEGEDDMLGVGIAIGAFFGVIVLVFLALLVFLLKGSGKKRSDYIADAAKHSKLSEQEIEAFERQALSPDSYILRLAEGLDRALSNGTNKDGLLTKDYIYLADPAQTVIRVDALRACCFSDYSYILTVGKRRKRIHCLMICLLAANGVSVMSDTTEKAGRALMELLRQRNSAIDTNNGQVLPEGAFDSYKKSILG